VLNYLIISCLSIILHILINKTYNFTYVSEHRDGNSMAQILVLVLATIFFGLLVLFYFHPKQVSAADQKVSNSAFDPKQVKLPFFWVDPFGNCDHDFKCTSSLTTGWNNSTSLQVSTKINKNNTWSSISGKEINVKPNENYDFVTHIKLNEFATGSHIKLEGYNTTSNKWTSLKTQCPVGTKGPLEWQEFSCNITIPNGITKIRPILNAGWSSQPGKEAVTLFDDISIINAIGGKGRGFIAGFIPSAVQS
jgi:hypothetical protein